MFEENRKWGRDEDHTIPRVQRCLKVALDVDPVLSQFPTIAAGSKYSPDSLVNSTGTRCLDMNIDLHQQELIYTNNK
jgi:hypothetical protein